jgi:hypothetical protein
MLFTCIECKTSIIYKHNIILDFIYPMVNFIFLIFKPNHYFEVNIFVVCILEITSIYFNYVIYYKISRVYCKKCFRIKYLLNIY